MSKFHKLHRNSQLKLQCFCNLESDYFYSNIRFSFCCFDEVNIPIEKINGTKYEIQDIVKIHSFYAIFCDLSDFAGLITL